MSDWLLFGTEGCHLCEEAQAITTEAGLSVQVLDIMDKTEWQDEYGIRIPVLRHQASDQELGWPFDLTQINRFVTGLR